MYLCGQEVVPTNDFFSAHEHLGVKGTRFAGLPKPSRKSVTGSLVPGSPQVSQGLQEGPSTGRQSTVRSGSPEKAHTPGGQVSPAKSGQEQQDAK